MSGSWTVRWVAGALIAGSLVAGCTPPPMPDWAPHTRHTVRADGPIIVVGDTQRTWGPERVVLGREQNEQARRSLISAIAKTETPAFVVHLGDLVTFGSDADEWEYFDRLVSPLSKRGIPLLPVLGNHDYWGNDRAAMREVAKRFPQLADATWYAMVHRGFGLVWLDTNLTGPPAREQAEWLKQLLPAFDRQSNIRGVLVFGHHPAVTNGVARHGDSYVNGALMPAFFAATKTLAYFAGHVHGYERFTIAGKSFVISAGAGGPRVTYHVGESARTPPAYVPTSAGEMPFHYLRIDLETGEPVVDVRCLPKHPSCKDGRIERFRLPVIAPSP